MADSKRVKKNEYSVTISASDHPKLTLSLSELPTPKHPSKSRYIANLAEKQLAGKNVIDRLFRLEELVKSISDDLNRIIVNGVSSLDTEAARIKANIDKLKDEIGGSDLL